jgi:hypothetical protein
MASKKAPAKVRDVYEREQGSGIWWIRYHAASFDVNGKLRRSEQISAELTSNLWVQSCRNSISRPVLQVPALLRRMDKRQLRLLTEGL